MVYSSYLSLEIVDRNVEVSVKLKCFASTAMIFELIVKKLKVAKKNYAILDKYEAYKTCRI